MTTCIENASAGFTDAVCVETPLEIVPAEPPAVESNERSFVGLVELVLKNPERLDALNRDEHRQAELIPRFLGIVLVSYTLFGIALALILNATPAEAFPSQGLPVPPAHWHDGSAFGLILAYDFGLVGATGICLPSFYFFSLLAGVRMSMLQLTAHIMRCTAASAVVLIGVLPVYVAVVLGLVVFQAPTATLEFWLYLGLGLPFLAGLEGVRRIYLGVLSLASTMGQERCAKRYCFLRRLTLSWAALYTIVSPVMIYRLWQIFTAAMM
jgi:hypothetical protein